jgi:malate synthase
VTEAGLRDNISVALQYLASWLGGTGAVPVFGLMEDLATAEIARAQVWQWLRGGVILDNGSRVTTDVVERMIDEELGKIQALAADSFVASRYGQAVALFTEVALADGFTEFLTLPAYERMP